MTNLPKKPELQHYDIKQQFNSLLYNYTETLKQYNEVLQELKNSIEETSPLHEIINIHHNKLSHKIRYIRGVQKTFKRFYKIYRVEKYSISSYQLKRA
ncbi:MAG: hypothetical protein FWE18_05455 [Alphaproteobacteria bacterium]|nr:hypothetical protein [Alphaproteobacteria bacterium]